jgi:uncharacterized membrane-anchored protein
MSGTDQQVPFGVSLWMIERLYEQTLAFLGLIFILNTIHFPLRGAGLIPFIKIIILLFAGQFTMIYIWEKFPKILADKEKSQLVMKKMLNYALPLLFLLFLAIMVGQLFSEHFMQTFTIGNAPRNVNMFDVFMIIVFALAFVLTLAFKNSWT